MDLAASCVARKVPTRFTSITAVNCSSGVSRKSQGMAIPAQFTSTESGPIPESMRSNMDATRAASPMSHWIATASSPRRRAAASTPDSSISASRMRAPSRAIAAAQAKPIPRAPPVISAMGRSVMGDSVQIALASWLAAKAAW